MSNQITTTDQQSKLKELIAKGKEQGFLTYGEVKDHLPDDISDPEQIEDIIRMINDWASRCMKPRLTPMTCSPTKRTQQTNWLQKKQLLHWPQ